MALINIESDTDPWLREYDACDKLQREIMEQFSLRSKERSLSDQYNRVSAAIRLRLKQYGFEVSQLIQKLDELYKNQIVTPEEYERRMRKTEYLESKNIQMQMLFNDNIRTNQFAHRKDLLSTASGGQNQEWGTDPGQSTSDYTSNELREKQEVMLRDQEKGLEELSKIISRQINIAETISSEVDLQNDIIDDLAEHMEHTDERIINETRQVRIVDRKYSLCGYWVVIIILFVSIVIVSIV